MASRFPKCATSTNSSLERATGLVVQNNPKLPACQAQAIAEQVWPMDYALIEDNATCE